MKQTSRLEDELDALARYLQRVRREIAAIDRPADDSHRFESMGEQMDAVVQGTEKATQTIMQAMENNEAVIGRLRERVTEPECLALLNQLAANASTVFEACSFQDITGQRVGKVAKSLTYVEQRVETLMELLGVEQTKAVAVSTPDGREKDTDQQLLNGPQLEGRGLSQGDIDKLFD